MKVLWDDWNRNHRHVVYIYLGCAFASYGIDILETFIGCAVGTYGILLNGNQAVRVPRYVVTMLYVNNVLRVPYYRRVDCIRSIYSVVQLICTFILFQFCCCYFYYKNNKIFSYVSYFCILPLSFFYEFFILFFLHILLLLVLGLL